MQDVRQAVRAALRAPGATAVAIMTLALGIGANAAIFSVVYAVMLAPLPFGQPDRLVTIWEESNRNPGVPNVTGPASFVRWTERAQSFEHLSAIVSGTNNLSGAGRPEELAVEAVTPNYFSTLDVDALYGRAFLPQEGRPLGTHSEVAILTYDLWRRRFNSDASVVGRTIQLNGQSVTVVGVMPPGVGLYLPQGRVSSRPVELWTPLQFDADDRNASGRFMTAIGRLREGVTLEQARSEMRTIAAGIALERPRSQTGWTVQLVPIREALAGSQRRPLLLLTGAVGFLLLIACSNIASLLLARGVARQHEMTVRRALGATRWRLARQMLVESLLLALAGGAAGLCAADWGVRLLLAFGGLASVTTAPIAVNLPVLGFTMAVCLVTALAAGSAPAWIGATFKEQTALIADARLVGARRHSKVQQILVVPEVTLAVILLAGAGLMLRSFVRARGVNPGFSTDRVLTARLTLPDVKYPQTGDRERFFEQVHARVADLPGVEAVGLASIIPLAGTGSSTSFHIAGSPPDRPGEQKAADFRIVDNGFFEAMRIPLIDGRLFTDAERSTNRRVALVNRTLARMMFGGESPIGRGIELAAGPPPVSATEIIGVVGDVRLTSLEASPRPTVYWPYSQLPYPWMTMVVRGNGEAATLAPAVERAVQSLDPDQPLSDVRTMDEWVSRATGQRRLTATLLSMFGAAALLLAAVGIYGVLSYGVSQRTAEIGLRKALGATDSALLRMVVGQTLRLTSIGLAAGLAVATGLARWLEPMLYDTRPADPATFAGVIALLVLISALAGYVPARRAARVEPTEALRVL